MTDTTGVKTHDEQITAEFVDYSLRQLPSFLMSQTIMVAVAYANLWGKLPAYGFGAWLAFAESYVIVRFLLQRHYQRHPHERHRSRQRFWNLFYAGASTGWGLIWASLLPFAFPLIDIGTQFLMTMLVMGMSMMGALYSGRAALWQTRLGMGTASLCWLFWGRDFNFGMALLGLAIIYLFEQVTRKQTALVQEKAELVARMQALVSDLDARNAQLALVNRAKTQLLATASHDVRQPIHAIGMVLDGWVDDATPAEHAERLAVVRTRIAAMSDMLQGLLDMSRLDLGVFKLASERVELGAFLRSQAQAHAVSMRRKGLAFTVDTQAVDGLMLDTDSGLLARMLSNLLTNAYKYTWQGSVGLRASRTGEGSVRIDVVDTGIGIPQDQQAHVFEEYVRLSERHESTDGVGIGLSVVAKGAALLGYRVEVASASGEGSTFSFILPPAAFSSAAIAAPRAERGPMAAVRILLIEDDADAMAWTRRVLGRAGHDVRALSDVSAALDCITQGFQPEVVVSDFQLASSRNGVEGIRAVRALMNQPHLPALLLTGDLTPQVRELALDARATVLHKPLPPMRLLDEIHQLTPGTRQEPASRASGEAGGR